MATLKVDPTLRGAVETAREAAVSIAESGAVGDHVGMEMVEDRLATHYFACTALAYRGWRWAITVARVSRSRTVTVCEANLVPGDVLVCLSVHGGSGADQAGPWSQNLVAAADFAKRHGAKVVALVGYDGGALHQMSDASVIVPRSTTGFTSTPHVEGFHEIFHHLICERLRQLAEHQGPPATATVA